MSSASEVFCRIVPMTPAHVRAVAKLHRIAFRKWMSAKIGDGYARAVVASFQKAPSAISLVAENAQGEPIGYAFGTSEFDTGQEMNSLILPAALGVLTHPWVLLSSDCRRTLLSRIRLLIAGNTASLPRPNLPTPTMALAGIGVSPAVQGQGVGEKLLRAFEEQSRNRELKSLMLVVRKGNPSAERLYQKCGWHSCPESTGADFTQFYAKVLGD